MNSNSKGDLIARLVTLGLGTPSFEAQSSGPAHDRTFTATVSVGGEVMGSGSGRSKRDAERAASEEALRRLDQSETGSDDTEMNQDEAQLDESDGPVHVPEQAPWPIYAQVLAQAVEVALDFADDDATLDDVQRDAAQFYRGLLAELGHGPEERE